MHVLLDRSSTVAPLAGAGLTVLLAGGALMLMLLMAAGMRPWPASGTPEATSPAAAPAGEPTLAERTRHEVVTGA